MKLRPETIEFFASERRIRSWADVPWKVKPEAERSDSERGDVTQEFRERCARGARMAWDKKRKEKARFERTEKRRLTWAEYEDLKWKNFWKLQPQRAEQAARRSAAKRTKEVRRKPVPRSSAPYRGPILESVFEYEGKVYICGGVSTSSKTAEEIASSWPDPWPNSW